MAKIILTTKVSSSYNDRPEEFYHFPNTYLSQARSAVGDFLIYYEPRRLSVADSSRGGRQAYFATARVDEIVEDRSRADHYYARVSGFLSFDQPVPFSEGGEYYESGLQKSDGSTNKGAFGRAVRQIPDTEFDNILKAGFAKELDFSEDTSTGTVEGTR